MDALRGNRVETALALVCLAGAGLALTEPVWGAALIAGLLLVQGGGYAAAPLNSIAAMRSWLPVDLRPRRFDGLLSWTRAAQPVRRGGLVLAGVSVSLVGLVVFAAPLSGPLPPGLPGEDEEPLTEPAPTPTLVPTTGTEAPRATAPVSTVGSTPPGTTTTGVPSPVATTAPATTASAADQPAQADPPAPEPTPTQATQPAEVTQPPQATQPAQASRRPSPPEPPDPSGGRP